ncbi:MAG: DUF1572 domain-containing protein [Saprospiraceae bacterium]
MHVSAQIAKGLRDVHFGGNWTASSLKGALSNMDWSIATKQVYGLNTIATLVFHQNYYIKTLIQVLQGGPLDSHDKYSFDHPPISSKDDWDKFCSSVFDDVEQLALLIEKLPEEKLEEKFLKKSMVITTGIYKA